MEYNSIDEKCNYMTCSWYHSMISNKTVRALLTLLLSLALLVVGSVCEVPSQQRALLILGPSVWGPGTHADHTGCMADGGGGNSANEKYLC